MEVDVGDIIGDLHLKAVSKKLASDNHIFKTHVIASECTSFIRKEVLNLSQLLIETTGLDSDGRGFRAFKFRLSYVDSLDILNHLEWDNQRDWYEVSEEKDPTPPFNQEMTPEINKALRRKMLVCLRNRGNKGANRSH